VHSGTYRSTNNSDFAGRAVVSWIMAIIREVALNLLGDYMIEA
jgi:hypothetical protein